MIGGIDIALPTRATRQQAMVASLRLIRLFWRDAVIEDAYTSEKFSIRVDALFPEALSDAFVYVNDEAARKWDELGAEPELANTMIQVSVCDQEVTIVVDDPDSGVIPKFLSSLRSILSMDIFTTSAECKGVAA